MSEEYRRFWIDCAEPVDREWLLAEAFELGAGGAEERETADRFRACIYVEPGRIEAVRAALLALAPDTARIHAAEATPVVDWSEAWKQGLEALVVSPRLVVRPPFIEYALAAGQCEIVIDPGQAFGTGAHASTRLCLEWMDRLLAPAPAPAPATAADPQAGRLVAPRVLDVGTGSGVLALAAIALGAERAIGFDLDPVAVEAAEEAAARNGLADRVSFFAGPIEALSPDEPAFPLVVANLLKREMLPIAAPMAARVAPGGRLVLAGLLAEDVDEVIERFAREQLVEVGRAQSEDAIGCWVGLCLGRSRARS